MANEYDIKIEGQSFWGGKKGRTVSVYFSMPADKILQEKGQPQICMLISGFLGKASSNVWKKMRRIFADKYNFVMVQCDYFGYEFMDNNIKDELIDYANEIHRTFTDEKWSEVLRNQIALEKESEICLVENKEYFCEMGLFQAMDCLRALKAVMQLMDDIGMKYDPQIIAYGNSQGAYLAYFMNALYPNLFANIIDNSAWLFPNYFVNPLAMWINLNVKNPETDEMCEKEIAVNRHFHAMEYIDDIDIYYLPLLYMQFANHAQIISFHGADDYLIPLEEKMKFLQKVNCVDLNIIDADKVDGNIFFNAEHGLGADFLNLFEYVMEKKPLARNENVDNLWESNKFKTSAYQYWCCLKGGMPTICRESF